MERKLDIRLGVLTVLLQVLCIGLVEPTPCSSGFASDQFLLIVHRAHLSRNYRIGTVVFNDCSGRTRTMFESGDKRFQVDMDGTVKLKRGVTLHTGHETFTVHAWDSKGKKHSALVRVEYENWAVAPVQTDSSSAVLVLEFPYSGGLRRRKREWVIPPVRILENERGPFPSKLVQIKSSYGKETTMEYKITGEGANEDPVGIFTIDKITGWLYVSKPLDREDKAEYKLQAHAYSPVDESIKEDAMEVIVQVLDQNDNTPVFTQNPFIGSVPESSKKFMTVNATDADAPNSDNSDIRYSILSQLPEEPNPHMFEINPITGAIRVNNPGMDREKFSQYNLEIQAADMKGEGRSVTGKVVITVTDSNDNAPQFDKTLYEVSVPENKVNALVVKMQVTDGDDPQSSAWATKFKIVDGNNGGYFSVNTGPNKQEGILTTVKALDFETNSKYTLLVAVENEIPFAVPLLTATATVIVNVEDVNEAPIFNPEERTIFKPEDLADEAELVLYTATDPDIGKNQKVTYRIGDDQAGWLKIDANTGFIRVKSRMDRESHFLKDGKYKALIFAVDDDLLPATGTGTLLIELEDVNDCAPVIDERAISICNKEAPAVLLSVTDKDGPGFGPPFNVDLQRDSRHNWTARMNDTKTGILLAPKISLEPGIYNVGMKVFDNGLKSQVNTIQVSLCDCKGSDFQCRDKTVAAFGLPGVLGILGAILGLLLLVLLLLLFLRRRGSKKEQPLITDDDIRDNVYYYDEEGGGEDDQDYDLSVLHRGLDNRPDVFRNDVAPTFMAAPRYRPRPANPDEIGNFIDDNLKAADNDPTAPPYDSLLVFDYEGGGSEAGSLSSLNSSGSGDQDYDSLAEWGPRFKKLADMYGGGED